MALLNVKSRPRAVAAVAALLLCACELTRDPTGITLTEDRVLVQSVLHAGDSTARVLLSLVPAESDPFNPFAQPQWIPIHDADVRVIAGADTITLTTRPHAASNPCLMGPLHEHTPAGDLLPGCYVASIPGGVMSGREYGLIIDLPGRGRVTGRTAVPTVPSVLEPGVNAVLPARFSTQEAVPFTTRWTGIAANVMAELRITPLRPECPLYMAGDGFALWQSIDVSGESTADVAVLMGCPLEGNQEELAADLTVTAFDPVYTRYIRNLGQPHRLADAAAGFTGPAIGVFASAASARLPVRFVPE